MANIIELYYGIPYIVMQIITCGIEEGFLKKLYQWKTKKYI